ncbi:MAG: FeoB-associated Cys-rich membrane protein [Rubritalea sp.]
MSDPQTIAALSIVALTVLIFCYKMLKRKSGSCGGGCSCSVKPKNKV